jgi:uncharacterized protein YacL
VSEISFGEYHRQLLLFVGFIGAIAVAALVLVLQNPSRFEPVVLGRPAHGYFAVVVLALSLVAVCSIFGGYAMAILGSKADEKIAHADVALFWFAILNLTISIVALMGAIPLMVAPSSPRGAGCILLFEIVMGVLFFGISAVRNREARKMLQRERQEQQSKVQQTPS